MRGDFWFVREQLDQLGQNLKLQQVLLAEWIVLS
jgi:hypothetical protein